MWPLPSEARAPVLVTLFNTKALIGVGSHHHAEAIVELSLAIAIRLRSAAARSGSAGTQSPVSRILAKPYMAAIDSPSSIACS